MSSALPVLKFRPVLMPKPWGGDGLWRFLKKGAPGDDRMGESWELSDRSEGETPILGGPLDGVRLADLLARDPAALLGQDLAAKHAGEHFPLLYKFISAREKLSVQVHPGDGSHLGEAKTECWYVVEAAPGAELIVGVRAMENRARTLELLKSPECEQALQRLPVRRGDVFHIPAGTVHAITEGLLLYELQQNSDTTFRLYDWGRVDAAGKPRALHTEEAGQVADLEPRAGYKIPSLRVEHATHHEDYRVACPYFALTQWSGFKGPSTLHTQGRFRVLTVVAGSAEVRVPGGDSVPLALGETALVPACLDSVVLEAPRNAEVLVSFVPDPERDVRAPLRAAGHDEAAIAKLFGPAPR
jgi:mannose-6-phosphate isomerase